MTGARRASTSPQHQRPSTPVTVGYVRTATGQSPGPQITVLVEAGVAKENIYVERANGYKTAWPERDLLLSRLHRGDTVKITRLDRLFYSIQNLIVLGTDLLDRGVRLHAVEQDIDSDSLEGRDLFGMLSALASLHRQFVRASTIDGQAVARTRGRTIGRQEALTAEQVEQVLELRAGETPVPELARRFKVSRATIYRHISHAKAKTAQDSRSYGQVQGRTL